MNISEKDIMLMQTTNTNGLSKDAQVKKAELLR